MRNPLAWLEHELPAWVAEGVISAEQAQALRARYPAQPAGLPWGAIIFGGLGAVIVGLGVILMLAYNWAAMPKAVKLGLILGAVVAAHGAGGALVLRSARWRAVGEVLCLVGTMFFGAGIWLVAQVYHLDAHYPNAFLAWGLGALLMAWVVPSMAQGALAALLLSIWCGCETVDFQTPLIAGPLLLLGGMLPLAWWRRSVFLLAVMVPALVLSLLFVAGAYAREAELVFGVALQTGALLIALGLLARRYQRFPEAAPWCTVYGWIIFLISLYLLTWPQLARELLGFHHELPGVAHTYWGVLVGLCLLAWALVLTDAWRRRGQMPTAVDAAPGAVPPPPPLMGTSSPPLAPGAAVVVHYEWLLVPLSVVFALCAFFLPGDDWLLAGPFNLVFLALATMMMLRGVREGRLPPTVGGSILLVVLMASRYADLFHDLWLRGLIFIVVGGVLIGQAILVSRARQRRSAGGAA